MDPHTEKTLHAAEEAAADLVKAMARSGRLYQRCPRAAAQVSRTAKWLLNAIAALRRELKKPAMG